MTSASQQDTAKRERTLRTSWLISSPGPFFTGLAALSSQSATQMADFLRRTVELIALFIAWWVFRKKLQFPFDAEDERLQLDKISHRAVTISMTCSGLTMFIVGIYALFTYEVGGNVTLGLTIALMGLLVNLFFWWRYRRFAQTLYDPVIAGQQNLYRAKAWIDLCVVVALATVAFIPTHPITRYVDALGSIVIAFYLFYQAYEAFQKQRAVA